jgi:hypothetical protein
MKYMLLIYGNEEAWNDLATNGRDALDAAHRELLADITASGEHILSNELASATHHRSAVLPPSRAARLAWRNGR